MEKFKKEARYHIIKKSDFDSMDLTDDEIFQLTEILEHVQWYREHKLGKIPLECVVIESDWPEYDVVWNMIRMRMEGLGSDKQSLLEHCNEQTANCDAQHDRAEKLLGALENLICEAGDLSSHEIDGGAPENRWEDMRVALMAAEKVIKDL